MIIKPIKTQKIIPGLETDIIAFIDQNISTMSDGSILAITSKVISIIEGGFVKADSVDKKELIEKEADVILDAGENTYGVYLTIKNNIIIPNAGIDESNGSGYFVLWPKDSQATANNIRNYISKKYHLTKFGVIITDSKTTPLRSGTTGVCLAHSGFMALKNYIGQKDIFDKIMTMTKANVADALAAAAVFEMGEGREQTPLAMIRDFAGVEFNSSDPSQNELDELAIDRKDDIYASLFNNIQGGK